MYASAITLTMSAVADTIVIAVGSAFTDVPAAIPFNVPSAYCFVRKVTFLSEKAFVSLTIF